MTTVVEPAFIRFLRERLQRELPGWSSQARMAPARARDRQPTGDKAMSLRCSAVLVLLSPASDASQDVLRSLFTVRSASLNHHGGQISFPGGKCENNESIVEAALRETHEEVGIAKSDIRVIGELSSLYVSVSNNLIHPVVGYHPGPIRTTLDPIEVEETFHVPLAKFYEQGVAARKRARFGSIEIEFPYWDIHRSVPLWGATAMIFSELLAMYEEFFYERSEKTQQ